MTYSMRPLALAALVISMPFAALAQQDPPPAPDTAAIAQSLGVSEELLQTCFPRPEPGTRPERPDLTEVTNCLRAENPQLAIGTVETVLKEMQPPPREN